MPGAITDLEQKVTGILAKLDNLPLDAISADLTKVLVTTDQTLKNANKAINRLDSNVTPGLKTTIEEIRRAITSADGVIKNADATLVGKDAPAQQELRDALQEIARAARSLRILTDFLEQHAKRCCGARARRSPSRLLKKTHMPTALSIVEGCAQSPRSNVQAYACARRNFARLASVIFLSSLQSRFFSNRLDKDPW